MSNVDPEIREKINAIITNARYLRFKSPANKMMRDATAIVVLLTEFCTDPAAEAALRQTISGMTYLNDPHDPKVGQLIARFLRIIDRPANVIPSELEKLTISLAALNSKEKGALANSKRENVFKRTETAASSFQRTRAKEAGANWEL